MNELSTTTPPTMTRNLADAMTPGVMVELTPDEAQAIGAIEETAISEADAWESNADLERHDHGHEHIVVLAPTRRGMGVGLVIPSLLARVPHADVEGRRHGCDDE